MPKAPAKKKVTEPVTQPTPQAAPPAESNGVPAPSAKTALPVIYDSLDIVEYSINAKQGPLTVDDAKLLLGWETEKDYQARKVAENPASKPEHHIYGEVFHCRDADGCKVRTTNNAHNRAFDETWCEDLIHTILFGQWAGPLTIPGETINGETVRISKYGRVLSGQHQMTALVMSHQVWENSVALAGNAADPKYPFWADKPGGPVLETLVITGLSEDPRVLMTIDYCKPRTTADVFYTSELFNTRTAPERKELCRMLDAASDFLFTRTDAQGYRTHPEMVGFVERHKRLLKCIEHIFVENAPLVTGGRKLSKLRLSAGQCSALCYLMACGSEKTDGDTYRNGFPPSETIVDQNGKKCIDWTYQEKAREFWARLATAGDKAFGVVRRALGNLVDSSPDADNQGLGGRLPEKLAIIAGAWEMFKDHAESAGPPFTDADLIEGGALCLHYSDLDDKGNQMPDGQIKLIEVADFYGIDSPQVVKVSKQEPMPAAPSREEIEKASTAALERRQAAQKKINDARANAKK